MRHFYLRALIEQRMGPQADWSVVDALMLKTLAAAEKVARYRARPVIGGAPRWRHQRQDGRRQPRRATGHDQAGVGQARPADRPGGGASAAGVENRGGMTLGCRRIEPACAQELEPGWLSLSGLCCFQSPLARFDGLPPPDRPKRIGRPSGPVGTLWRGGLPHKRRRSWPTLPRTGRRP